MNHRKNREGINPRTKRGTIPFTLRWQESGKPTWDEPSTYYGSTMDSKFTFNQHRERVIQRGLEKGHTLIGEVRGDQIRQPIAHSEYVVLAHGYKNQLFLYNTQEDKVESWVKNDDHSGFGIEYGGYLYEFVSGVVSEEQFDERTQAKLEALRRIHKPTEDQTKPTELVEREVHPEHEQPRQVGEDGFEKFKKTGIAPIPVPSHEELERVMRPVKVAERDDEGKVRPTAAYFAMNPLKGEIVEAVMQPDDFDGIAKVIATYFMQDPETAQDRFQVILTAVAAHVHQGSRYDWPKISAVAKFLVTQEMSEGSEGIKAAIEDMTARMTLEQNNDYSGKSLFAPAHLVASHGNAILEPLGYIALCGEYVTERFVGLDQFKEVGAPPFTPICGKCIEAFGTGIPGKGQTQFVVDESLNIKGKLQDGSIVPLEEVGEVDWTTTAKATPVADMAKLLDLPERKVVDEHWPAGTDEGNIAVIADARLKFEEWVSTQIMSSNPKAKAFYYFGNLTLALFYYKNVGQGGVDNRPLVHHWLGESGTHKVIATGSDYYPNASNFNDPTGIRSAMEYLAFYEGEGNENEIYRDWREFLAYHDQYGERVPDDIMLIPDYGIAKYDETLFKQTYEGSMVSDLWASVRLTSGNLRMG
jgi:hypothetical protein